MSKRPSRSRKRRPPATRLEEAPSSLGGLPDSDITAITLVANASHRHGWPDLLEAVCHMPLEARARIGELLLQIDEAAVKERDRAARAAEAERERAQSAAVMRAGRIRLLAETVEAGGEARAIGYALAMTPAELAAWRAKPLGYGDPLDHGSAAEVAETALLAHR